MFDQSTVIGVCGAGAMGAGIAQVAAQAGHKVVVLDQNEEALTRGRAAIEKGAAALLNRGKISEEESRTLVGNVSFTLNSKDLGGAGLVIEAIIEDTGIKQSLYGELEQLLSDRAVIATNTSSQSVTQLASSLKRPRQFLGLHFFNPAPVMKLVEVVRGTDTEDALAQAALALMESWGKKAVMVRDVPGFIVNRVARPFYGEGWRALEEGAADAATIDFLLRDLAGFRMGPFELGDLIGHDINYTAANSVYDAYFGNTRFRPSLMQGQLVAAGRFGRKSGRGVYDHAEGAPRPAPTFLKTGDAQALSVSVGPEANAMRRLFDACGVPFEDLAEPGREHGAIVEGVDVSFTCGKTANQLSLAPPHSCIVLDWVREPQAATAIAFAASDDKARGVAVKLAAALGKNAIELADRPGLVVFRTLAQLANCAADAVRDQVADREAIDRAMMFGVNYPFGPLAWALEQGAARLVSGLKEIAANTGDIMYSPSEALRRLETIELKERRSDV